MLWRSVTAHVVTRVCLARTVILDTPGSRKVFTSVFVNHASVTVTPTSATRRLASARYKSSYILLLHTIIFVVNPELP